MTIKTCRPWQGQAPVQSGHGVHLSLSGSPGRTGTMALVYLEHSIQDASHHPAIHEARRNKVDRKVGGSSRNNCLSLMPTQGQILFFYPRSRRSFHTGPFLQKEAISRSSCRSMPLMPHLPARSPSATATPQSCTAGGHVARWQPAWWW